MRPAEHPLVLLEHAVIHASTHEVVVPRAVEKAAAHRGTHSMTTIAALRRQNIMLRDRIYQQVRTIKYNLLDDSFFKGFYLLYFLFYTVTEVILFNDVFLHGQSTKLH